MALHPRTERIVGIVSEFIGKHGRPPTAKELGKVAKMSMTGSHCAIANLKKRGIWAEALESGLPAKPVPVPSLNGHVKVETALVFDIREALKAKGDQDGLVIKIDDMLLAKMAK